MQCDAGHQILQPINANASALHGRAPRPEVRVCDAKAPHRHTWRSCKLRDLPIGTGTLPQVNEDIAQPRPTLHFGGIRRRNNGY